MPQEAALEKTKRQKKKKKSSDPQQNPQHLGRKIHPLRDCPWHCVLVRILAGPSGSLPTTHDQCIFSRMTFNPLHYLKYPAGVPVMAQQKRIQLGIMRLQVRSMASLSGLRIWRCCELWCRSQMWLGSGIAVAVGQASCCSSNQPPSLGPSIC